MARKILIIILLSTFSNNLQSYSFQEAKIISEYFESLYSFEFNKSDSILSSLPKSPEYSFIQINNYWWKLITTDNKKNIIYSNALIINHDKKYSNSPPTENEVLLNISIQAFKLRFLLYNKQYYKAYKQAKFLVQIISSSTIAQDNEYTILIYGLMNYFGNKAYKKYPFVFYQKQYKNFSDTIGIILLEKAAKTNNIFVKTESLYFLVKIYYEVEENYEKALFYSSKLTSLYPDNAIFGYYHLNILINLKKNNEAKIFKEKLFKSIYSNNSLTLEQIVHIKSIITSNI